MTALPDDSPDAAPEPAPKTNSRAALIRWIFLALVIAFAAWAIIKQRHALAEAWHQVRPFPVVAALVFTVLGVMAGFPQWRELLSGLGSVVPLRPAARVFFLGQLGKYVPGGVWNIVAQASLARELHVPRARSATAGLMAIVVVLPVLAAISAVTLAISGRKVLGEYWWTLLLVVPLLAFLQPDVLVWLARLAARITKRQVPLERIPGRRIGLATVWTVAGQIASGLSLMFLVEMFTGSYPSPLLCIGISSLGLLAGMLVVFAPAGAGAREAVLVLGLSPYMDPEAALLVALLARVLSIIADGLLAGASSVIAQHRSTLRAQDQSPGGKR